MQTVFLSYRGPDEAEVRRLEAELVRRGWRVRLASREIRIGGNIVGWIGEAVETADVLVLCLSRHGSSGWQDAEWRSVYAAPDDGRGPALVVVRLTGGEAPLELAELPVVDLVADWEGGVAGLVGALGALRR